MRICPSRWFFTTVVLASLYTNSQAQKNCYFKPDAQKITRNENLSFFLSKLQAGQFSVDNNKNKIPRYVREQLTCLIGDSLLANPNEKWNSSDVDYGDNVATRQLVFFAQTDGVFVIVYSHGGIVISNKIVLMRFFGEKLVDLWSGKSSEEILNLKGLLGYLQENKNKPGVLNYEMLDY